MADLSRAIVPVRVDIPRVGAPDEVDTVYRVETLPEFGIYECECWRQARLQAFPPEPQPGDVPEPATFRRTSGKLSASTRSNLRASEQRSGLHVDPHDVVENGEHDGAAVEDDSFATKTGANEGKFAGGAAVETRDDDANRHKSEKHNAR